ncbi:hypothetical protein ABB37_01081 [Leptomonas pyrrhocoris]|uniref:Uncharacterized protein n=1 Tax=Leptomonas pyrrhocoris TaxID=157538 RepID=A0A0N0VH75_LEPPY|nr:hypothetical protein ABB37_01081 [Leptomonas pyrrhocoris]KPA84544.1 hypothetical protein ABB37_01081 [Leptomonas pyrrhocoris]|eukprot:XP_015662983.1 hypothetical protein ABB37_01081 [Leptomonas pyrrhocoris]
MAERTWCPSLGPQRDNGSVLFGNTYFPAESYGQLLTEKTSAKRNAAVAANSDASARAISDSLAFSFQRHFHRFDAAVVASNANRLHWPSSSKLSALQFSSRPVPVDAAVCLNMRELPNLPTLPSQLAIPADSITELLSLLARRSTRRPSAIAADELTGLIGLPSINRANSMVEVFSGLVCSKLFLKRVQQLTICDASAGDGPSALADFARSALSLEALSLVNCVLHDDMAALMEALKDHEVKYLSLERSGIGCASTDAERETVLSSLSTYLKLNKFLTTLDLSYTNLDADGVSGLMSALTESDTQMLPQDMNETADVFDPSDLSERLDRAQFTGAKRKNDEEDSEGEGGEEEAEADGDDDENLSPSQVSSDDASENDDDADDNSEEDEEDEDAEDEDEDEYEDEDEEENEDKDEGQPNGNRKVSSRKSRRTLARERLRAERQRLKQLQRQMKQLVQLETRERRTLMEEYLFAALEVVTGNSVTITKCYVEEKQKAKELYCSRRSGWSHLQELLLRGNCLGDAGAKHIALVLREDVPLSEDETQERQEAADAKRDTLGADFGASRANISVEEAVAWRVLRQTAENEFSKIGALHDETAMSEVADADEEDEYAKEAPPVVLTNVENGRRSGGGADDAAPNDDDADELLAEEKKAWEEWVAEGLPQVMVESVKKGMRSISLLDLGSCQIGRKGLEALADVLRTNTVLESLCLRHNPIGGGVTAKSVAGHRDAASAVSASFVRFVEMLGVNKSLRTLDLGYCQLGPDHVRALATALRDNPVLVTLGLEGNQFGVDEAHSLKQHAHSYLYALWMAAAQPGSALRHLHMSHNSVALCLWSEETAALAAACGQLSSLSLSHVGLQASHLQLWSEALRQGSGAHHPTVRVLQLARNELAGEAGGAALGSLLQHFTLLEELSLDDTPLLGSAGVAAALEHLPTTMRRLSCGGVGLTEPFVGAAPSPVIPLPVTERLTSLMLCDVEAPTAETLAAWTTHLAEAAKNLQYLSLWARGMAGKENEVLSYFVDLAQMCPSLLYVDSGFQPQFRASASGGKHFVSLEKLLLPRRTSLSK